MSRGLVSQRPKSRKPSPRVDPRHSSSRESQRSPRCSEGTVSSSHERQHSRERLPRSRSPNCNERQRSRGRPQARSSNDECHHSRNRLSDGRISRGSQQGRFENRGNLWKNRNEFFGRGSSKKFKNDGSQSTYYRDWNRIPATITRPVDENLNAPAQKNESAKVKYF